MKDKLLTLEEAMEILRVSRRSMYRYVHTGKIKAVKIGYWKIPKKELDAFIKKQWGKQPPKTKRNGRV